MELRENMKNLMLRKHLRKTKTITTLVRLSSLMRGEQVPQMLVYVADRKPIRPCSTLKVNRLESSLFSEV